LELTPKMQSPWRWQWPSDEIEVQAFTVVGRQSVYRKQMLENFLSRLGSNCAIPPPPSLESLSD